MFHKFNLDLNFSIICSVNMFNHKMPLHIAYELKKCYTYKVFVFNNLETENNVIRVVRNTI